VGGRGVDPFGVLLGSEEFEDLWGMNKCMVFLMVVSHNGEGHAGL